MLFDSLGQRINVARIVVKATDHANFRQIPNGQPQR